MIRHNRGDPPANFGQRADKLRDKFKALRTKHPEIKASEFWKSVRRELKKDASELATRFHFKCAYCESRMRHVSHPHIEHYRPKGQKRFEHLMFDWTNWLLSCGICNDEKWTEFPERNGKPLLLDPCADKPCDHIGFRRSMILPLSDRGDVTIRLIGLGRRDLEVERALWLMQIDLLLLLSVASDDAAVRLESRNYLIWAMQDDAPYTAMTRLYLAEMCPQLAKPPMPHPHVIGEDIRRQIATLVEKNRGFQLE